MSSGALGWVRLTSGVYHNDVAKIVRNDRKENKIDVLLIPRLDYTQPQGGKRPPRKLLDVEAVKRMGAIQDGELIMFKGKRYSNQLLNLPIARASPAYNVKPTPLEIKVFQKALHPAEVCLHLFTRARFTYEIKMVVFVFRI